ncbi:hypothetical protein GCM10010095_80700 [Streptomyces anthocyanicus]|nr:hypothetical protein SLITK23_65970 [Streptomyces lividans]GGL83737.1 hypothetical protein GCM10010095_80700 [Streptomyces anthocyanicus]GHC36350.1 hypothetical protein GCM10010348_74550 [Streptomyces anthocyanicus]
MGCGAGAGQVLLVPATALVNAWVPPTNGTRAGVRDRAGGGVGVSAQGPRGLRSTRTADRWAGAAVAGGLRRVRRMRIGMRGRYIGPPPRIRGPRAAHDGRMAIV